MLHRSKAYYLSYGPFVKPEQLRAWEEYTRIKGGWVEHDLNMLENDPDWKTPIVREYMKPPIVIGLSGPVKEPNYTEGFVPSWQAFPPYPQLSKGPVYNLDSSQIESVQYAITNATSKMKYTIMDRFLNIYFQTHEYAMRMTALSRNFTQRCVPPGTPLEGGQSFYYPIFDDLNAVRIDTTKNHTAVGILSFSVMYHDLMGNILPENSNGIHVVLHNPCSGGQTFTMQIDGAKARFVVSQF